MKKAPGYTIYFRKRFFVLKKTKIWKCLTEKKAPLSTICFERSSFKGLRGFFGQKWRNYFLPFFPRIILSKAMVLKGDFFPAKHFQIHLFLFRTKKSLSKIYKGGQKAWHLVRRQLVVTLFGRLCILKSNSLIWLGRLT